VRNMFSFLKISGFVQMKDPDDEFLIILESEVTPQGLPLKHLLAVYFGRILHNSARKKNDWRHKGIINRFHLSKRNYLGPTSMDTELSFIIANFAQVQRGDWVFDPFVGTGSLLLACSLRGAYTFGTDIDIRILRGDNEKTGNVYSNFQQYGLILPDVVRSDNALYFRHYNHKHIENGLYHAIVTDPPYGIRAGARRSGSKSNKLSPILDCNRVNHKPQTKPYHIYDVVIDLLNLAARTLVHHGRLVYIIPSLRDFDINKDIPSHPCLKTVHVCYQPLQLELGRYIITMEKVITYDIEKVDVYREVFWKNGQNLLIDLKQRLAENVKNRPDYDKEKVERRRSRRKELKRLRRNIVPYGNVHIHG